MRIGYPCINRALGCRSSRTFRLASYSEARLIATVSSNLDCLRQILEWNLRNGILFFRITSDLIPFASHPICTYPWQTHFRDDLASIGVFIRESGIRISMHPDQFIIINSPDTRVVERSIDELSYHTKIIDLMDLDTTAKIQLHVGGKYRNPLDSITRFIRAYDRLDPLIQRHLVVENDDRQFNTADCLNIHDNTGIPVLFDVFHHTCNNRGESTGQMLKSTGKTWKHTDGTMMVDYSTQHPLKRAGSHAERIDMDNFHKFLQISRPHDLDIMLEIKDKEASALAAISLAKADPRFIGPKFSENL